MEGNFGYLDQEVEQYRLYEEKLKKADRAQKRGIGCGTLLLCSVLAFIALAELSALV